VTKAKATASKRRTAWGRYLLVFFVAGWMFILGVLVGRGTAPVNFDTQALQKELANLRNAMMQKEREAVERAIRGEDKQKKLEFYKALRTDEPDTAIATPEPEATSPEPPAAEPTKAAGESPTHKKKAAVMAKSAARTRNPKPPIPPKPQTPAPSKGQFAIQVVAMKDGAAAERIVANLKKDGYSAYLSRIVIPGKGLWFRVRVGSYPSRGHAAADMQRLVQSKKKPILVKNE